MNWYWPEEMPILSWLLNIVAKIVGFKKSNANKHDVAYWKWWTEKDRIRADTWFLRYLLIDSEWIWYKILLSYIFYFAVRIFWGKFFNYIDKHLEIDAILVLLLPSNFMSSRKNKEFKQLMEKYSLLSEYDNEYPFVNTKIQTKIFVFKKEK